MKTIIFATALAALASPAALLGVEAPVHPADPSKTPEGLSNSDWSGIRGAYERQRHAVVANPDGTHQARNPGQAWLTKFDGRGFIVTPNAGGWSWGLELAGYGEVTEVRQDGGKISYVRGDGLTEWFINDGRGLEQGWTLARRPVHAGMAGPIRLHLAVRGSLHPQVSGEGASVAFMSEAGSAALTYGGLKAWDADGKVVQARFADGEVADTSLCVVVDDAGARYPITIDPIAQQAYLKASSPQANMFFGYSVAISGDTVVVGAPGVYSGSPTDAGAAYVFVRIGSTWRQQGQFGEGPSKAEILFGSSVAVDGDTAVVGCPQGSPASYGGPIGSVHVYVRNGETWTKQVAITGNGIFGTSVAVSGDTLVVGQVGRVNDPYDYVYVYTRSGTIWNLQATINAPRSTYEDRYDAFGSSVSLSGNTLVVGAPGEASAATGINGNQTDNSAGGSGAAFIFTGNGSTWTQRAYLKASNTGAGDGFGSSVAISGDTVVVGAPYEASNATGVNGNQNDNSSNSCGAAYVFAGSGATWSQQAYLKASNTGSSDKFGGSVAISGDTVVVGARSEQSNAIGVNGDQTDNSAEGSGAAYVFMRNVATWSQRSYVKASNTGAGDGFGSAVAVDGDTFVVGARGEGSSASGVNGNQQDNSVQNAGAAFMYIGLGSYSLSAVTDHGAITGAGNFDSGTTATLTATASPGYVFAAWTGDATGNANPLSVLMDADKTITANFTPDTNDDDADGLTNYQECVEYGTDPTKQDTDNDGVKDYTDAFPLDPAETLDTDHDGIGDNADPDDDGDGLSDVDEINTHHTNPKLADSDGDGLSDPDELQVHTTNPNIADTDNDGLNDGEEFLTHHTNPKVNDTDADGFLDGYEVLTGKSPLDIADHPALVAEARTAIEFTFPAALGKTYRIEDSPDLATWTTVESGIAGNGQVIQRFYTTRNMDRRYFRVEEDAP